MSWQTTQALYERKLHSWEKNGVITKRQVGEIMQMSSNRGFWEALGYATRLKYKNLNQKKKYEYKWLPLKRDNVLLCDYVTSGLMSNRWCKRHRVWRNTMLSPNEIYLADLIEEQYPDWEIFHIKQNNYFVGLRRLILDSKV